MQEDNVEKSRSTIVENTQKKVWRPPELNYIDTKETFAGSGSASDTLGRITE